MDMYRITKPILVKNGKKINSSTMENQEQEKHMEKNMEKHTLNMLYSISNKIANLEHTFQISIKLNIDGGEDDDNFYYLVDSDDSYEDKNLFDEIKEKILSRLITEYRQIAESFILKHKAKEKEKIHSQLKKI